GADRERSDLRGEGGRGAGGAPQHGGDQDGEDPAQGTSIQPPTCCCHARPSCPRRCADQPIHLVPLAVADPCAALPAALSYTPPMPSAHPPPSPARRYVMTFVCEDRPGIVHAITGAIVEAGGNIVESRQFESGDSHRFYMRVEILTDASLDEVRAALAAPIESFGIEAEIDEVGRPVRTLVLTSKSTHCLNDLLFQTSIGNLPIEVPLVIANHDTPARYAEF